MNKMIIYEIKNNEVKLVFRNPFIINYQKNDDGITYDNDAMGIYVYCKNEEELKNEFKEYITCDWLLYVKDKNAKLDANALKYRNLLKKLLFEVII